MINNEPIQSNINLLGWSIKIIIYVIPIHQNQQQFIYRRGAADKMQESPEEGKERPFICPCGKSYLSYPALFTHIKQKHNGNPPGEIIRPKTNNKRGRPRKNFNEGNEDDSSFHAHTSEPRQQQNKNPLERYYHKNDQQDYDILMKEAQLIKNETNSKYEFKPPISFGVPSVHRNNHYKVKEEEPARPVSVLPPKIAVKKEAVTLSPFQKLQDQLLHTFTTVSNRGFLLSSELEQLLQGNKNYQRAKVQERQTNRKAIGPSQWEMQLRTGSLQFMDWCKGFLPRWQSNNMEVLVGLLLIFYSSMLPEGKGATTSNYVSCLNYFTQYLLCEIKADPLYKSVYALEDTICMRLLAIMHEWFTLNSLSYYQVRVNPYFKGELPGQQVKLGNPLLKTEEGVQ